MLRRRHRDVPAGAAPDPTIVAIADTEGRRRVKVGGQVTRMRARPVHGLPSLSVTIDDGTGTAIVVWPGRREIGGITLGRRLVVEGVPVRRGELLEFTSPAYTLLP